MGSAPANALAPAETGAMRSRCTWPNETASWNASANSARYEPSLERDRNQRMVVSFARLMSRQTHSAGARESLLQCNNADNWAALRFICVLQKINIARIGFDTVVLQSARR